MQPWSGQPPYFNLYFRVYERRNQKCTLISVQQFYRRIFPNLNSFRGHCGLQGRVQNF